MPRATERVDTEQGRLDDYPLYVQFLAEAKKERAPSTSVESMLERKLAASSAKKDEVIISPLLKEVMEKKLRELERETAKMRQKSILAKQSPQQPGMASKRSRNRGGRNRGNNAGQAGGKKKGPRRQNKNNRGKKKTEDDN